jgi:hypothetical protein
MYGVNSTHIEVPRYVIFSNSLYCFQWHYIMRQWDAVCVQARSMSTAR